MNTATFSNPKINHALQRELCLGVWFNNLDHLRKYIGKEGTDVNYSSGLTPLLMSAACNGYEDIVTELIEYGADYNVVYGGESVLLAACRKGQLECVKILINSGADITFDSKENGITDKAVLEHLDDMLAAL